VTSSSQVTLVDYDSFLIPEPMLTDPGEAGHAHFQHPQRDGYYASNMDAFPALVIYLSLLALSKDPGLWNKYHDGDNLLFTADDYLALRKAPVWRDLKATGDPVVQALAERLAQMCEDRITDLEPLSDVATQVERKTWWASYVEETTRWPRVPSPHDMGNSALDWPEKVLLRSTKPLEADGTPVPIPDDDDWDYGRHGPRRPSRRHPPSWAHGGVLMVCVLISALVVLAGIITIIVS
jgi:hypothetical protein